MARKNFISLRSTLLAAALIVPGAAFAQATWANTDWDSDGNLELSDQEFATEFNETGTFNAWDRDDTVGLSEGEFATGMFHNWDRDRDLQITEEEYGCRHRALVWGRLRTRLHGL